MRRVLLDENLPHALQDELPGFDVWTVAGAGWAGVKNGELLRRASEEFDVFLTADRVIPHQHNLGRFSLAFVLLAIRGTKLEDILPYLPQLRTALGSAPPGEVTTIEPE